jgi:hypothetical protein
MAEEVESLDTLVEAGSIPLLMMVLTTSHEWKKDTNAVRREVMHTQRTGVYIKGGGGGPLDLTLIPLLLYCDIYTCLGLSCFRKSVCLT